jgi:predicted dehydrogenase
VVVVGDVGLEIPRAPYYDKELELRLSRSYGPGRYDREYEARGLDYPIGYVRWTERRNMGAVTELLAQGKLDFTGLITEKLPVDRAPEAYERLLTTTPSPLALILEYEPTAPRPPAPRSKVTPAVRTGDKLGLVGAGNFAQGTLIPAAVAAGFELAAVASATGRSAEAARERFGFQRTGTAESVITGDDTDLVVVATRHSSHAPLAGSALASGKSVFLEKPPCLTQVELSGLRAGLADAPGELFVGFNRRHAPLAEALRSHMADRAPIELLYRVNAGLLPANHWLNDPEDGGGRLLGEGCHFIDFACWLVDALPCRVACSMRAAPDTSLAAAQSFSVLLDFPEGSSATILYGAAGASGLAKEYVEVHGGGRSAVLDDFRSLVSYDGRKSSKRRGRGQDKGHRMMMQRVRDSLASGVPLRSPSPLDSMAVTFAALRAAETGQSIDPLAAASTARSPEASVRL